MSLWRTLRALTAAQRKVVAASFLGWMLDSFDFFVLVFVLQDVAADFHTNIATTSVALGLTLVLRPVGALIFGAIADRYGRRPTLMADVAFYSLVEMASGFSPNLTAFLALRALYGIAMGGEWGIGAALALESVPTSARGAISGLLQCGYPCGYLLASVVFGALFPVIGWRGMFILGGAPALLVLYIRRNVPESPAWHAHAFTARAMAQTVRQHWRRFAYCIVMVAVFSFGTHGTQDIYPTMLRVQRGLSPRDVSVIATLYTIGGMFGTLFFGAFSERIGRSRTIILAMIGALLTIPLWAFATNLVALTIGAIVIQFLIQGAAGVLPAHLNELSPDEVRGTFPGLSYQLGTLFPAANATLQIGIAEYFNNNYALALALVAGVVTVLLPVIVGFGYEAKGVSFGGAETQTAPEQRSGAV